MSRFAWAPAACCALVALLVALVGWYAGPALAVDIGAPGDAAFITDFYEPERLGIGDARWTPPSATFWLPATGHPEALALRLVGRPGGMPLTIVANGAPVVTLNLQGDVVRRYELLLPPADPSGRTLVQLRGADRGPIDAVDTRRLTVLVDRAELQPLSWRGLPPLTALLPALIALAAGAGLWLAGVRPGWAWAVAGLAGAALAWGWGWQRLLFAPFLPATLAGAAALAGLLGVLRVGAARDGTVPPSALFGAIAAATALVPLYLSLDFYWPDLWRFENIPALLLPAGLALLIAPATRRPRWAAVCLIIAGAYALGMLLQVARNDYGHDFNALYEGVADFAKAGMPLYILEDIRANPLSDLYKYPPTFALFFYPFALPAFVPALYAWRIFSLLMLGLGVWALARAYELRWRSWAGAGLLLILLSLRPIVDTLRYGQMDLVLLGLFGLALLALRRGQHGRFGLWIGLAAGLKLYPAYLFGLALVQRRWYAIFAGAATLAIFGGLALLAFGWETSRVFLTDVLGSTGVGTGWVENQTFNGFLNRIVAPWRVALEPDAGGAVKLASYVWFAALTALTMWLTRAGGPLRPDIGFGLWITALLLVLPVAWIHYGAILLIPPFQAFVLAEEREDGIPWPAAACYLLAWALLAHGNHWTIFDRVLYGPFWTLVLSYKFYGVLLLYLAVMQNPQCNMQNEPEQGVAPAPVSPVLGS